MIPFKDHKSGFTFVEVVLSIALLGMILSPSLSVQSSILSLVTRTYTALITQAQLDQTVATYIFEKKSEKTKAPITCVTLPPHEKSALQKFSSISIVKATDQHEVSIRLVYTPPAKEKK